MDKFKLHKKDWEAKKLPQKLSDILELALEDLNQVERDPNYYVSMGVWHTPSTVGFGDKEREVCMVCLAGSLLAKSVKIPLQITYTEMDTDRYVQNNMRAIDNARVGDFQNALYSMGVSAENVSKFEKKFYSQIKTPLVEYERDSKEFKKNMKEAIEFLREEGY